MISSMWPLISSRTSFRRPLAKSAKWASLWRRCNFRSSIVASSLPLPRAFLAGGGAAFSEAAFAAALAPALTAEAAGPAFGRASSLASGAGRLDWGVGGLRWADSRSSLPLSCSFSLASCSAAFFLVSCSFSMASCSAAFFLANHASMPASTASAVSTCPAGVTRPARAQALNVAQLRSMSPNLSAAISKAFTTSEMRIVRFRGGFTGTAGSATGTCLWTSIGR
mmetsp:Transcript_125882/g.402995  ORF Transcript_125882/g.402995 Transcript_125882/m.402995 type:complete len:224 (+) Transcript_125882:2218-2889(+)